MISRRAATGLGRIEVMDGKSKIMMWSNMRILDMHMYRGEIFQPWSLGG
jgi:hypothetical protein